MKGRLESHGEFSHSAESVSRAMALTTMAASLGFLLGVAGAITGQLGWAAAGLAGFSAAWMARCWLQRGEASAAERVINDALSEGLTIDDAQAAELMRLLEDWEREEAKRGTADFDPWALQALRNEIRCKVEGDPALEELFDRLRQAA